MLVLLGSPRRDLRAPGRLPGGRRRRGRAVVVSVPFSIYLGWITVAFMPNATIVLFQLGWAGGPLNGEDWTRRADGRRRRHRLAAGRDACPRRGVRLVLAWAFWGIAVQQGGVNTVARWAQVAALYAAFVAAAAAR
ncbi:MAG: hypothetical protein U0470_01725 [Anaerolineae bacterium]